MVLNNLLLLISSLFFFGTIIIGLLIEFNLFGKNSNDGGDGIAFGMISPLILVPSATIMLVQVLMRITGDVYTFSIYPSVLLVAGASVVFIFFSGDALVQVLENFILSDTVITIIIIFFIPILITVSTMWLIKDWFLL